MIFVKMMLQNIYDYKPILVAFVIKIIGHTLQI